MLILKLAARNLLRHTRRTVLLLSIIIIVVMMLFVSSTIFENTNAGLKKTFIGSFTGELIISELADSNYSLFGSEIPILSEYESIPPITQYKMIEPILQTYPDIIWSPVVSTLAQLHIDGNYFNAAVFGVDPKSYFDVCHDVIIDEGNIAELAGGGVFINSVYMKKIKETLGRDLKHGEEIVFAVQSGDTLNLRKGHFSGVHRYVGSNEALDNVILTDATIARSLANYTLGFSRKDSSEQVIASSESFSIDDLFASGNDIYSKPEDGITLEGVESSLLDTGKRDSLVMMDSSAWSFILIRDENISRVVDHLEKEFSKSEIVCRLMSWRDAAGTTAQSVFMIQLLSYIGLGFITLGALLIVVNALVVSVLERTAEIATMRSLGANRFFISKMFIIESALLSFIGSCGGVILGLVITLWFKYKGLYITNPILRSLFGGNIIRPEPAVFNMFMHVFIFILIGSITWIYPVSLAMKTQPVRAMDSK